MDIFVARQPIFNTKKEVVAYELLYRNSRLNTFGGIDGDTATSTLITNSLLVLGLDTLTQNKKAFINFTFTHLKEDTPLLFSKDALVVEILEDVEVDQNLVEICKNLKKNGFVLALDDFIADSMDKYKEIYPYIDIIKVDFMKSTKLEQMQIVNYLKSYKLTFLAEKVEKESEFLSARSQGYSLFQGYFFSKPIIVDGKTITPSKFAQFQLLNELSKLEPDVNVLSQITQRDLSISYKILRLVNSAAFRRASEIKSIKQALVFLGLKELQKWLSFVIVQDMGADQPEELVWLVFVRAKFGESITKVIGCANRESEVFLMGLFSCIDVFFNRPIEEVIAKLPLATDVKDALMGKENQLSSILKTVISYEKGEWENFADLSLKLRLERQKAIELYIDAVSWANQIRLDTFRR
jgi:EAL and modified HD-GYP domain-containing signal transduction protein